MVRDCTILRVVYAQSAVVGLRVMSRLAGNVVVEYLASSAGTAGAWVICSNPCSLASVA